MMLTKSGFKEAPPTRKPSMSGLEANSLQFAAVTEPTNKTRHLVKTCQKKEIRKHREEKDFFF